MNFKNYFRRLKLYFNSIPKIIAEKEKIVRIIFSPLNINSKGEIKANAFRCRIGRDDLSVTRLDYSFLDKCKKEGVKLQNVAIKNNFKDKNYFGIALLFCKEIKEIGADVIHIPVKNNSAHGEIKTGYLSKKGEPRDPKILLLTDELARKSRKYEDNSSKKRKWSSKNKSEIYSLRLNSI